MIAPRLSIARSNPYARPYASAGTTSASNAFRAGTRNPRAVQAPARSTATCHTAVAGAIAADNTAVAVYPPTASVRRRCGSSANAPPPKRATPASASLTPSIAPNTDAGAPSVEVSSDGSNDVGISCPTSASRLAPPMPLTPGVSQAGSAASSRDASSSCSMDVILSGTLLSQVAVIRHVAAAARD